MKQRWLNRRGLGLCAAAALALWGWAFVPGGAQTSSQTSPQAEGQAQTQASNAPELSLHETEPSFKLQSQRNLVLVRVVARDSKGRIIGNLRQQDFRLSDNGKPQTISHFSVETPGGAAPGEKSQPPQPVEQGAVGGQPSRAASDTAARRFLGLYFDDVNIRQGDLMQVRQAAAKYLAGALLPGDRAGLFTASGLGQVDFTDDRDKLQDGLLKLQLHPVMQSPPNQCPDIFDYQAFQITQFHDLNATQIAVTEYEHCRCQMEDPGAAQICIQQAPMVVDSQAFEALNIFETQTQAAIRGLEDLVRHMAVFPGQRSIVLVSPGFLTRGFEAQVDQISERALRTNVLINTLDAKGLYAPVPGGDDITQDPIVIPRADLMGEKEMLRNEAIQFREDVLRNMAYDTGGYFFHNSNDLGEGFRLTGTLPEVYYVLGFSPAPLKPDGHFHTLKVTVTSPGIALQARRGYYAPSASEDSTAKAKEEIKEAVFSQDELNELPVQVQTQLFKRSDRETEISVVTRINLQLVHFRKADGRNLANLEFITAVFDRDGKYVASKGKTLDCKLRDQTLARLTHGVMEKESFSVPPGTYMVREVVRDYEGGQISALTRTVEIPY